MTSVYDLKPQFQSQLRPLTKWLAHCGVTPNQITVLAVIVSCGGGTCLALAPEAAWALWLVPPVLFVRMVLNAIDGMLAREYDMQTDLGLLLNEIGDVLSDSALYLPFALVAGLPPLAVIVVVILAIVTELAGVCATQIGSVRRYDGPMGKSDRAIVFGTLSVLLACGVPRGAWISGVLGVVIVLLALTIVNRVRRALHSQETCDAGERQSVA